MFSLDDKSPQKNPENEYSSDTCQRKSKQETSSPMKPERKSLNLESKIPRLSDSLGMERRRSSLSEITSDPKEKFQSLGNPLVWIVVKVHLKYPLDPKKILLIFQIYK
ncbi:hypothetical protein CEXT_438521 [Caerostris extrusa]|uniref:Uncharacterized protein n=1 Tax=Caerostris extrusa TaxID=172846 RepID=A0AAV4U672_CAEEX|nr:hypothetical protein CEXT_438521 [Caerostris extrusa]